MVLPGKFGRCGICRKNRVSNLRGRQKIERSLRRRAEGPLSERTDLSRFLLPWPFDCGYSRRPSVGGGVEGAGIGGINRELPRLARPRRFRSETRGGGRAVGSWEGGLSDRKGGGGESFSVRGRWVMRGPPAHLRSFLNRWCLGPPAQAGG